ncbi:Copper chaperone SCO1/SenC, partial [Dillenia turbinata]
MASSIPRKASSLRQLRRCFFFSTLTHSRSSMNAPSRSPLLNHLFRSASHPRPSSIPSQIDNYLCRGIGTEWLVLSQKHLYSTRSTTAGVNSSGAQGQSGDGDKSGDSKQTGDAGNSIRGGPVSWLSFILLVITGTCLIYYYDLLKKQRIEEINANTQTVKHGPSVGKAAIGGPFSLINHDGKPVTEKDFVGKWTLIYFGFTHCPDICPDELIKLAAAIDKIKEKVGLEVVPLFISVDPERDTVEQVREYVKEFHPNLIGLTGDAEEIRKTARAFRVYYMKTEEEDSDYLVDHSIVMYLMGPEWEFVKFFGKNNDVDSLTEGVIKEIKQF